MFLFEKTLNPPLKVYCTVNDGLFVPNLVLVYLVDEEKIQSSSHPRFRN